MPNPYENYGILDFLKDAKARDALSKMRGQLGFGGDYADHNNFYMNMEDRIKSDYPDIYKEVGARKSGNQMDAMLNFIGSYDWAARKNDPQGAVEAARMYQYLDSSADPTDAAGDFSENKVGAEFYNPKIGRLPDDELIKAAYEFSRGRDERQNYDNFDAPISSDILRYILK